MSGGVEESFNLSQLMNDGGINKLDGELFWHVLVHARKKRSVICCNLEELATVLDVNSNQLPLANGLVRGHAYIVASLATVPCQGKEVRLVKCVNPWGNNVEWRCAWSKGSDLWQLVRAEIRDSLVNEVKSKGHFWMSYDDWLKTFDLCQIVNLTPDSIIKDLSNVAMNHEYLEMLNTLCSTWQCYSIQSKWTAGVNSGGCGHKDPDKFWTNPQFLLILADENTAFDKEKKKKDRRVAVIISLMQKPVIRKSLTSSSPFYQHIQFRLYRLINKKRREVVNGPGLERIGSSGAYFNKREVTLRFQLSPGEAYVIIASTFEDGVDNKFLLRVFAERPLVSLSALGNV